MKRPNLFKYATSELSQDAFICWLLAWNEYKTKESQTAKSFIAFLYNAFMELAEKENDLKFWENVNYNRITSDDVGAFEGKDMPKRQKFNTDVFFVVNIKDNPVAFIIEDKTNTYPHSNQLSIYVESISKAYKSMPIVRIYYKTGYLYPEQDEVPCRDNQYRIITAKDMLPFLTSHNITQDIYQDYISFIENEYVSAQENAIAGLGLNDVACLNKEYVKYEFMRSLAESCGDSNPKLSHAHNVGGAWAQYQFLKIDDKYGSKSERLFYRVETFGKKVALSLRQYAKIDKNIEHSKEKLNNLKDYKKLFNKHVEPKKECPLKFETPRKDSKGANSSQIALLYIQDHGANTISNIYNELPKIHKQFIAKVTKTS